jgi:hypothetical protein
VLEGRYAAAVASVDESDISADIVKWKAETGIYPALNVMISVASSDPQGTVAFWSAVASAAAPVLSQVITGEDSCVAYQMDYATSMEFGWQPAVRYVSNPNAQVGKYSVEDYDAYVGALHELTARTYPDWSGWDNFLDLHIGLESSYENGCKDLVLSSIFSALVSTGVAVGERSGRGGTAQSLHFYVGAARSSMAWILNVNNVTASEDSVYSLDDQAGICACITENNAETYYARYGVKCGSDNSTYI